MENAFSMKHPELIGEWSDRNYPLTPDAVTYGSKKMYGGEAYAAMNGRRVLRHDQQGRNAPSAPAQG